MTAISNKKDEIREKLTAALKGGDVEQYGKVLAELGDCIAEEMREEIEQNKRDMKADADRAVLAQRGIRQLTADETSFYQKLAATSASRNPKQEIDNLSAAFPETVLESVFEDLRTRHPLLSRLNLRTVGAATKIIYNADGTQEAAWGELCAEIVKELTSGFKVVPTNLLKISAFLPVCKQAIEFGYGWLDRYVREVLYEAIANAMESKFVSGTGKDQPIGMDRYVADDVVISGGEYPQKVAIDVERFDMATVGGLMALLANSPSGKPRDVRDVVLLVSPADYYSKVMPATSILTPTGAYQSTMPFGVEVIRCAGVAQGTAVFGTLSRYFATVGSSPDGRIGYSDEAMYLEDKRVYIIKAFANGFPMDNNAFLLLDISNLAPAVFRVENVTPADPSSNALLASLSLGAANLTPVFAASTDTYTSTTTAATNTINAVPQNASTEITITVTNTTNPTGLEVTNGSAITWDSGTNTVTVATTAADGTTGEYTVTVTKS